MLDDQVDELLDAWEIRKSDDSLGSPEEFLAKVRPECSPDVRKYFLRKVALLSAIDSRLHVGETDQLAVTTDREFDSNSHYSEWKSGDEPVEGYVLSHLLGSGGFGEVWQAQTHGGVNVALKFVRLAEQTGKLEADALDIICGVRHANLLSVVSHWQVGGYLIVATELADRTISDRFDEALVEGYSGIPRMELLGYLGEAAKAIDFLNLGDDSRRPKIQHGDIKPQNLLLSGGSVKVGDFGLVNQIDFAVAQRRGGLTVAYAAPEVINGKTSSQSDQYSLAVAYCQLLTGNLPFDGPRRLSSSGAYLKPDLSGLPQHDRSVVARALSPKPKDRWRDCKTFVEALSNASTLSESKESHVNSKPLFRSSVKIAFAVFGIAGLLMVGALGKAMLSDDKPPKTPDSSTEQQFDGTDLSASIDAQTARDPNADAIENLVANFPVSFLNATHPAKPEIVSQGAQYTTVRLPVTVSVDLDKYHLWAKRLDAELKSLANGSTDFTSNFMLSDDRLRRGMPDYESFTCQQGIENWLPEAFVQRDGRATETLKQDSFFVVLATRRSERGDRMSNSSYKVSSAAMMQVLHEADQHVRLQVAFRNADGEEIVSDEQPVHLHSQFKENRFIPEFGGLLSTRYYQYRSGSLHAGVGPQSEKIQVIWLHPVFSHAHHSSRPIYRTELQMLVEAKLSSSEVKAIRSIKCQFKH